MKNRYKTHHISRIFHTFLYSCGFQGEINAFSVHFACTFNELKGKVHENAAKMQRVKLIKLLINR